MIYIMYLRPIVCCSNRQSKFVRSFIKDKGRHSNWREKSEKFAVAKAMLANNVNIC